MGGASFSYGFRKRRSKKKKNETQCAVKQVSHEATLIHIDGLIQYLKEQDDTTLCHKFFLKKLQSQVKKKRFQKKKKIDFFVKK